LWKSSLWSRTRFLLVEGGLANHLMVIVEGQGVAQLGLARD
jgi:hypothetical protein